MTPAIAAAAERRQARDAFVASARRAVARANWKKLSDAATSRLAVEPAEPAARFALAVALLQQYDLAGAAAELAELTTSTPARESCDLLAIVHALAGDLTGAVYHRKLAESAPSSPLLRSLTPPTLTTLGEALANIRERPFMLLAQGAMRAGDWAHAERWFRQHLHFERSHRDAHIGLATVLLAQGAPEAAAAALRAARAVAPEDADVATLLARTLASLGAFDEAMACHRDALAAAPDDAGAHAAMLLDRLLDPDCKEAEAEGDFRRWGARFGLAPVEVAERRAFDVGPRRTVGYLLAGRGAAADAGALADILAHRDRGRYRTVGFGYGALSHPLNAPFQRCFDRWTDVADVDVETFAAMVAAEQIDVLVDAAGFSAPHLLTAFGARMAPCQIAWLDAPYPAGLASIDYLLTDDVLDPLDSTLAVWPARRHRLALGAVVMPTIELQPATPRDHGRPPTFAADALLSDLIPETAFLWSRVVRAVEGSVLVLRDHGFAQSSAAQRLSDQFGAFGVAHRIEMLRCDAAEELFAAADVALLPPVRPQLATVAAALAVGVPVVALGGKSRRRRAAVSALSRLSLACDCVAEDLAAYVALAGNWARCSEDLRDDFRRRLGEALAIAPACDARARMADLEAAYDAMWRQLHRGDAATPMLSTGGKR